MELSKAYLEKAIRNYMAKGFPAPKWAAFSWYMLDQGFFVSLYRAKKTNSKYVTVSKGSKKFKVRFSDHKPIRKREANGDCDFFVGITNYKVTNTKMAIEAVFDYFKSL